MDKIKLIISDIDGTILDNYHVIDSNLVNTIPMLKQYNIPFVLASARSPLAIQDIYIHLQLNTPIISYNGALISKLNTDYSFEHMYECALDAKELKMMIDFVTHVDNEISINLYSKEKWYVPNIDIWNTIESQITAIEPIVHTNIKEITNIHKILLIGNPNTINIMLSKLKDLHLLKTSFYLSKENYLEIVHKDVSKLMAVKQMEKHYSLSKDNIMTIGDNYNDIPMLSYAKYGIAMGNAPHDVKKVAFDVTDSNMENGVSKVIIKYCL